MCSTKMFLSLTTVLQRLLTLRIPNLKQYSGKSALKQTEITTLSEMNRRQLL